ncbi:acyl transferase/acyl hydrolase/lysophospholipase [Schizophyllum commune]
MVLPPPGVRLLAFDDGGMRGLAMLLLLRSVLREFQQEAGLRTLPLPCERFDIIAGSGTGGLIALLLGRLRLSIDHAIECYARVVEHVFMQVKSGGTFKSSSFDKVLKEIANRFGEGEDTPLLDSDPFLCRTFVCTREDNGSGGAALRKLRTYSHPTEHVLPFTLVDAVRATMGNPTFFKPLSMQNGDSRSTFLDAGDDHCNPVYDVLEEARCFYPAQDIAYLLSLGPGTAPTVGENAPRRFIYQMRLPGVYLPILRHLADRCDHIASRFREEHGDLEGKYCRLTPSRLSPDGRILPDQEKVLEESISQYLAGVYEQVSTFVLAMTNERAARRDNAR